MIAVTLLLIPLLTLLFDIHAHTKDFITENNDHVKKVGSTLSTSARVEGLSVNTYKHSPFLFIVVSVITILSLIRETTIAQKMTITQ